MRNTKTERGAEGSDALLAYVLYYLPALTAHSRRMPPFSEPMRSLRTCWLQHRCVVEPHISLATLLLDTRIVHLMIIDRQLCTTVIP